jgi:16S rRNA (uracil1498-N3)-methyltransferase
MSALWVYVENLRETKEGDLVTLAADEGRHVVSRRLRVGDALVLFDGQGAAAVGQLEALDKKAVVVRTSPWTETLRPGAGFILATAIPKGDRLSTMLQMLSQLGVERWQPLILDDSAVRKLDPKAPRLSRILIESCKVARRPWALEIEQPSGLEAVVSAAPGRIFYGDSKGESTGMDAQASLLVIGPEAGLTGQEKERLVGAGAQACNLGAHNLRIETAAIAGATAHHLARLNRSGSRE